MKTLILGAGAIGGYIGGRLQQSGADVTFLVRPARREALAKSGLVIKSSKGDVTQKVKTVLKSSEGGPYDIVLLTNKAYDMDSAIEAIAPAVGSNTAVVPLLNGMNHLDVLDAKFGAGHVAGGVARIGVALSPEGEVRHTSPFAAFSVGERGGKSARPALIEFAAAIKKAGLDGGLHDNIEQVSRALEQELLDVLTAAERETLNLVLDKLERRSSDIFAVVVMIGGVPV